MVTAQGYHDRGKKASCTCYARCQAKWSGKASSLYTESEQPYGQETYQPVLLPVKGSVSHADTS